MNEAPRASIVIASFVGEESTRRCLESIGETDAEIIVATRLSPDSARRLRAARPGCIVLRAPEGTSVFALRSLGAARARGRLVAFTEDHAVASPAWLASLLAAHDSGAAAVGGPVTPRRDSAYGVALFLSEYGRLLPPSDAGRAEHLSAVNSAYDREALLACRYCWENAFHENEVHDALRAAGHSLHMVPHATVATDLDMRPGEALAHLYRGGRTFGSHRVARSGLASRLPFILASPAVPWIILARIARRGASALGWSKLARSSPWLLALVAAWSAGECLGYLWPLPAERRAPPLPPVEEIS